MKTIVANVLILFVFVLPAQHILKGKVTNENNEPLVGANVFLPELNKGTVTNERGEYVLFDIPKGRIKMQVSHVGYSTVLKLVNVAPGETVFDVVLSEAVLQAQEVVITAGYVSSQHESPLKVNVLTERDLKFFGSPNVVEALTSVSGVDMLSNGQGNAKPVIRGLSRNDVMVLNNGVRMENYQLGEHHPMGVDVHDAERVEIIQGPMALQYGSDALGGVINFIKDRPAPVGNILGEYFLQFYSNTLGWNNGLSLRGASKGMFGGIGFAHKTHADFLQGGGEFVPDSRFNEFSFEANGGLTGRWGISKIYVDHHDQKLGLVEDEAIEMNETRGRKNENWYLNFVHDLFSLQNTFFVGKAKIDANAAMQQTLHNIYDTSSVPFNELRLQTLTYEGKLRFEAERLTDVVMGFQGMYQQNRNLNDRPSKFLPDANIHSLGVFSLASYSVSQAFKLLGGLRLDGYQTNTLPKGIEGDSSFVPEIEKFFYQFSGAVGASYAVNQNLFFKLNLAKGFRAPNIAELTSQGIHENRFEMGDSTLVAVSSYQLDVNMHYHAKFFMADVSGFYHLIDNYIYLSPTGMYTTSGLPIYKYSQADAKLFGGEAILHVHPPFAPWLHFQTSYNGVLGKKFDGTYLPLIPSQKLRYEIRFDAKKWKVFHQPSLKISAVTALAQNYPSPEEEPTPGYTLFNLSINTSLFLKQQQINFGIAVNNLFDKKYVDHLYMLKELGFYAPGRNISLTLQLPFNVLSKAQMQMTHKD